MDPPVFSKPMGFFYENITLQTTNKQDISLYLNALQLSFKELIESDEVKENLMFARTLSRQQLKQFSESDSLPKIFDLDKELRRLLQRNKKISAIILVQQNKLYSLIETKRYVDDLEQQLMLK